VRGCPPTGTAARRATISRSGFYSTDYGQGEQKPESAAPASNSAQTSDKRSKKTDEKATKKPEPE
jgi:predicted nucleic acid-binding Zn ribbon protein